MWLLLRSEGLEPKRPTLPNRESNVKVRKPIQTRSVRADVAGAGVTGPLRLGHDMGSTPRYRLRLSSDDSGAPTGGSRRSALIDPYKLDRRCEKRHGAEGALSASYSNGRDRFGITHLELVDRSARGLGVRTCVRIEPGEVVTICPEGSRIPWVSAKAVRCVESDGEFVVGLKYCASAAAA